jgi:tRNA A37 N6-isopentenylltransferase MiaA
VNLSIRSIPNCVAGYKEFHDYLNNPTEKGFEEAVENMKLSTRRYAKRQVSWIRNKLLPATIAANALEGGPPLVPTYLLNATGVYVTQIKRLCSQIGRR